MRRIALLVLIVLTVVLWMAPPVGAQSLAQMSISTQIPGARIRVDGTEYISQATFTWPVGSKHTIDFPVSDDGWQYNSLYNARFLFAGWADGQSLIASPGSPLQNTLVVTADTRINKILASVSAQYQVKLVMYQGSSASVPPICGTPGEPSGNSQIPSSTIDRIGVVYMNGACYWNDAQLWLPAGELRLNAYPFPGYVFIGWKVDVTGPDGFLRTGQLTGPMTLYARFSPAKRVKFRTDPPGLRVRIDREDVFTAQEEPCTPNNTLPPGAPRGVAPLCIGDFDFAPGSTHIIGTPPSQMDKFGRTWMFTGFSNGMKQNDTYVTSQEVLPSETIIASFQRGISTSVTSKPPGLKLAVDGRDNWAENYFVFLPGSKHTISAVPEQVDAHGRKNIFKVWSNGGAAAQEVTVPADPDASFILVAEYDRLSQLIVRSNPYGADVIVDGGRCRTPCNVDRADGTDVRLSAPLMTNVTELNRLEFISWSDGGSADRTYKVAGTDSTNLSINYRAANKISLGLDPPEGGRIAVDPASADGFYSENSLITLRVEEKPGFRFRRWDYDVSGTSTAVTVSMIRPRTAVARFDKVPYIAPAGIRNAAGQTPDGVVAPGSLISILGDGLAPYAELGPTGPILSQVLAGTTVVVGNRILPLVSVSPQKIDAQLPRDLTPGEYELRVIRVGQPDLAGKFTVAMSAPGIFNQTFDDQAYAVGQREDGSPLAPDKVVKRGEMITLSGTGFGPYEISQPDGFVIPPFPPYKLASEAEVWMGDVKVDTVWAGGAAGQIGIDQVKFQVPKDLPEGVGNCPIKIRIDGRDSNLVLLPVE